MAILSDLRHRLRALIFRDRFESSMNEELREHSRREVEKLMNSGLSLNDAMRRARFSFGAPEQIKEQIRDARGTRALEILIQDLRYAYRSLRKSPGFSATVILALALGIGVNTVMFGVINALLFRLPAGISHPENIFEVILTDKNPAATGTIASYPDFLQVEEHSSLLEVAAEARREADFGSGVNVQRIRADFVTHTYFDVLGTHVQMGRTFSAADNDPRNPVHVAILGYSFWRVAFAAAPDVLNREVVINAQPFTVIGVAPKDFNGAGFSSVDVWLPIATTPYLGGPRMLTDRGSKWFGTIGRPRNGASAQAAQLEASSAFQHSGGKPEQAIQLVSYFAERRSKFSDSARVSLWLAGTALLVLLIACANVSNLFLERLMQRRREMAVRLQLGATRARLISHQFAEIALLGFVGGISALGVVLCAAPLVRAFLFTKDFYLGNFMNWDVLWLAIAFTVLVVGCLASLVVRHAGRANIMDSIKTSSGLTQSLERSRLRAGLLATQAALSLLLAVGAALFVRSLNNVHNYDMGFEADKVLLATVDLDSSAFKAADKTALFARMGERAALVPGVDRVALATTAPMLGGLFTEGFSAPGSTDPFDEMTSVTGVTPDYFAAMGVGVLAGRTFSSRDTAASPQVIIVNDALARDFWPGQSAVGKCLILQQRQRNPCTTVIGIVRDERRSYTQGDRHPRYSGGTEISGPDVFVPLGQATAILKDFLAPDVIVIRTAASKPEVIRNLSSALQSLAPADRYVAITPMTDLLDSRTRNWRLGARMFSLFSALALALTCLGIYGLLAYSVRQRTAEIGIRMALGAQRSNILRIVLLQAAKPLFLGLIVGAFSAFWLSRFVESLLFQVKAGDLASYLTASLALVAVALVSCSVPAIRATRVEPIRALRYE
ncbi:MAG TPA: ABC transporter permease [Candidatus Acidoferrales bacterium]|nr:ABC transporter permease [Candidatus Acidoferrales bacterium]